LTHLCPRGKIYGDLDKVFPQDPISNMKFLQPSDIDSLFREPQKKRKVEESNGDDKLEEETKIRCPCPICGSIVLEEDINNHLDICLNRSAVLEMVREEDKKSPLKIQTSKGKLAASTRKRRR